MILAIKVKLIPSEEQSGILLETMKTFNEACNYVSEISFKEQTSSVVKIHHLSYYQIREEFKLPSQMAVRVIGKVAETYKSNKKVKHVFKELGAIVYDERILKWKGLEEVSLVTVQGRTIIPIVLGSYQKNKITAFIRKGQAELVYEHGKFFLIAYVDVPETPIRESKRALGVDLGVNKLAIDSMGEEYSGKEVEQKRVKLDILKAALQKKGTKSAKRHLKKISGREERFRKNVNHVISKQIIEKCIRHSLSLAIEDLKGIRERATVRHTQRRRHYSWAFNQLRNFLEYKARLEGVLLSVVDPRYTSQKCSRCGFTSKKNRRSQSEFICQQCGFTANADFNGALNIASLATINLPIVAPVKVVTSL